MDILVPREDVNDDSATLVRWLVENGTAVSKGQPVAILETSKTVYEVVAPGDGPLQQLAEVGQDVTVGSAFARLAGGAPETVLVETLKSNSLLTKAAQALGKEPDSALKGWVSARDFRAPSSALPGIARIVLIGAGSVGLQALDILLHDPAVRVAGFLDDHPQAAQRELFGHPLLGKVADLVPLFRDRAFDQALITVGLNLKLRMRLYELCRTEGIPMANAIDPSARLNRFARLGQGNILCSFVHLGVLAELGDNNFLAAHTSVDHHNRIGSHNLFGPGCLLSGTVRVGDRCTFGSGVVVQPNLSVGDDCLVASGTVILKDIPNQHAVRLRLSHSIEPLC